jgi:hypothetical protein
MTFTFLKSTSSKYVSDAPELSVNSLQHLSWLTVMSIPRHKRVASFKRDYDAEIDQLREANAKRIRSLTNGEEPPPYNSHQYAMGNLAQGIFAASAAATDILTPPLTPNEEISYAPFSLSMNQATLSSTLPVQHQHIPTVLQPEALLSPVESLSAPSEASAYFSEVETELYTGESIEQQAHYDCQVEQRPQQGEAYLERLSSEQRQQSLWQDQVQDPTTILPEIDYDEIQAFTVPVPQTYQQVRESLLIRRENNSTENKGRSKFNRLVIMTSREILSWKSLPMDDEFNSTSISV